MKACRCTPTLKCCSEGVANSSLPQLETKMATHIIHLNLDITMEEMDGSPECSAEILLELDVLGKVIKLLEDEGFDAEFADGIYASEREL